MLGDIIQWFCASRTNRLAVIVCKNTAYGKFLTEKVKSCLWPLDLEDKNVRALTKEQYLNGNSLHGVFDHRVFTDNSTYC